MKRKSKDYLDERDEEVEEPSDPILNDCAPALKQIVDIEREAAIQRMRCATMVNGPGVIEPPILPVTLGALSDDQNIGDIIRAGVIKLKEIGWDPIGEMLECGFLPLEIAAYFNVPAASLYRIFSSNRFARRFRNSMAASTIALMDRSLRASLASVSGEAAAAKIMAKKYEQHARFAANLSVSRVERQVISSSHERPAEEPEADDENIFIDVKATK